MEANKKTLPECLINISHEFNKKDCERALEVAKNIELDAQILIRELKQILAINKYS